MSIKGIFEESKRTYASPRITAELKRRGVNVSKPRVAKLMRLNESLGQILLTSKQMKISCI